MIKKLFYDRFRCMSLSGFNISNDNYITMYPSSASGILSRLVYFNFGKFSEQELELLKDLILGNDISSVDSSNLLIAKEIIYEVINKYEVQTKEL